MQPLETIYEAVMAQVVEYLDRLGKSHLVPKLLAKARIAIAEYDPSASELLLSIEKFARIQGCMPLDDRLVAILGDFPSWSIATPKDRRGEFRASWELKFFDLLDACKLCPQWVPRRPDAKSPDISGVFREGASAQSLPIAGEAKSISSTNLISRRVAEAIDQLGDFPGVVGLEISAAILDELQLRAPPTAGAFLRQFDDLFNRGAEAAHDAFRQLSQKRLGNVLCCLTYARCYSRRLDVPGEPVLHVERAALMENDSNWLRHPQVLSNKCVRQVATGCSHAVTPWSLLFSTGGQMRLARIGIDPTQEPIFTIPNDETRFIL